MTNKFTDLVNRLRERNYEPGSFCTVNGQRDLVQDKDKGEFMHKKCVIIKRCKSGLLLLAMADNPKKQNSFAEYNISDWKEEEND